MSLRASAESLPYKFTGKEQDKETGLYYFGARYYDARISRWISTDPALEKYLPNKKEQRNEEKLPSGGIYEPVNIDMYGYVGENPIIYIDPDGNFRFGKRPLNHSKTLSALITGIIIALITPHPTQIDKSFEIMDKGNIEAVHEHGFYDNSNKNIGYWKKGYMRNENINDYVLEDVVYDDKLMEDAQKKVEESGKFDKKGENYSMFGNNCQDFADALRQEYKKLYSELSEKEKKEVDARVDQIKQKIQQEKQK